MSRWRSFLVLLVICCIDACSSSSATHVPGDDARTEGDRGVVGEDLDAAVADTGADANPLGEDCGKPGQECCPGNLCGAGGCCVNLECVAQGESCAWEIGGTCDAGSCGSCGVVGQPCCLRNTAGSSDVFTICTGPRAVCDSRRDNGQCVHCGDEGDPCCVSRTGDRCIGAGIGCQILNSNDDVCSRCGGIGERCCDTTCRDGACCLIDLDAPTASASKCVGSDTCGCQDGECSSCGVENRPCCAGNTCMAPLVCLGGTCGSVSS